MGVTSKLLLNRQSLRARRYGPCEAESLKGRMKRAVALLGEKEVQRIMEQEGKIEVCLRPQPNPPNCVLFILAKVRGIATPKSPASGAVGHGVNNFGWRLM